MAEKGRKASGVRSKIFIVDDHPLVRRGLTEVIDAESHLKVCGEAGGVADALRMVGKIRPDLMIVDLSLDDGSGLNLIKQVKAQHRTIRILVSSMHDEFLFAEQVLRAGASGYLNKKEATDRVIEAIDQILSGRIYLSNAMTERMLNKIWSGEQDVRTDSLHTLSDRELEVFRLLGEGYATREIAERLHLSVKTIETYREHIKRKLDLRSSSELTRRAVQWVLDE